MEYYRRRSQIVRWIVKSTRKSITARQMAQEAREELEKLYWDLVKLDGENDVATLDDTTTYIPRLNNDQD